MDNWKTAITAEVPLIRGVSMVKPVYIGYLESI